MKRQIGLGVCVAAVLMGLVWPGPAWMAGRMEPRWLGVPIGLWWIVGWVGVAFASLWFYDRGHDGRGEAG